jgi:1-acyl-sn-glycerol-3-phosphate acyltransferase
MKFLALIRSILVTLFFPFTVIILGPLAMLCHYIFFDRKLDDYFVSLWGRICCRMCGVRVVVDGEENRPIEGCLYLFNHSSFFDVFALAGYMPGIRFGAKAELFKIPIFSQTMRAMNTLPIARNNRDEVYKIYEEAKARFANGEQFALSPEGGRYYGPELSPFKAGPFIFAMSAAAPVVPVVIIGAYQALPKGAFLFNPWKWSHTIHIKILKPIETTQFAEAEQRKELQKLVYDQMNPIWVVENAKVANS